MRTNIVIDDQLMAETLCAAGLRTKREAVELGLRTLLRLRLLHQEEFRKFRGKLQWKGYLDQMRAER
jgi:Arc/MetJ family transcription regulator